MRTIVLFMFLLVHFWLSADEFMIIKPLQKDPNDLSAQRSWKRDVNDELCAIIKVNTDLSDLRFSVNLGVEGNIEFIEGAYWIYVSPKEKRLRIMKKDFVPLDYEIPVLIESSTVYTITVTNKDKQVGEVRSISSGMIYLNSEPSGADVRIDGEYKGITPYQSKLYPGEHSFSLTRRLFSAMEGSFRIYGDSTTRIKEKLTPVFGSLSMSTSPESGASIEIDNKLLLRKTPFLYDTLESGKHSVTVRKEWYEPLTHEFVINNGETTKLDLKMNPIFGTVKITSNPEADIFINDQKKAFGKWDGRINAGLVSFKATKERYYPSEKQVELSAGSEITVNLDLKPIVGDFSIITHPPEAEIFIDGKSYGLSPKIIRNLMIGKYEIEFRKEYYTTVKQNYEIRENEETPVEINLGNFKEVTITSDPKGATLYLNGVFSGETPKNLSATMGQNHVKLTKPGYVDFVRDFNITENLKNYSFTMISDAQAQALIKVKRLKTTSTLWWTGCITSAVTGGYFMYTADKHYKDYQTESGNATALHKKIEQEDLISWISFGVSGACLIPAIITSVKKGSIKRKFNLSAIPAGNGAVLYAGFHF